MSKTEGDYIKGPTQGHYGTIQPEDLQCTLDEGDGQMVKNKTDEVADRRCCNYISDDYVTEIRALFNLAWPISLTIVSFFIPATVAVIFCGHLGTTQLNSVALATSFITVTSTVIIFGMTGACDTYFSQYHGSVNRHKLGVILQKSLLILLLTSVPCATLQLNGEACLRLVGQDPEVSRLAGRYLLIATPAVMFYFVSATLLKFLQCQNVVIPSLVISYGAILVNILLHYCFISVAKMGTDGSALAYSVSHCFLVIGFILYVCYSGILKETWQGWSLECLEEWGDFFKLGILGTIAASVDIICFEISLLLAGLLSETDLAAQAVLFQLNSGSDFAFIGVGMAAGVRVGNMLGAGNKESAKRATKVAMIASVLFGVIAAVLFIGLKSYLPFIYTTDRDSIHLASKVTPLTAVRVLFMCVAYTAEGILRSCGRQAIDAVIVLSGHAVSLSVGIPLMFATSLGILGQWTGYGIGMFLEAIVGTLLMITTDWDHQVQRALQLTKSILDDEDMPNPTESHPGSVGELQDMSSSLKDDTPLVSTFSSKEPDQTCDEEPVSVSMTTILKRLCALIAVLIVLLIGVIIRLTLHIDRDTGELNSEDMNTTSGTTSGDLQFVTDAH